MRQLPTVLLLGFLLPGLAAAQSTVGFSDPDELTALLEYRLPDWGWQTWDLAGQFSGAGSSHRYDGDADLESETARNDNDARLNTRFDLWRESERRDLRLGLELGGSWSRSYAGVDDEVSRDRSLSGYYSVSGEIDLRPSGGAWSVAASALAMGDYRENRWEHRSEDSQDENVEIASGHGHLASLGIGLGRIRDVTPLVRAERLNERLVALGRPRLAPAAIQHVAEVLAREYGYRRVFDRPERRFWSDVLEPLIGGEPLSVAEVFYLTDVMQENLGTRWQGARV